MAHNYKPVKHDEILEPKESNTIIKDFIQNKPLEFVLGVDKNEDVLFTNLASLPHLLIGGTTGSGKSNFIHSLISCLIKNTPNKLGLVLIDPKKVELSCYDNLPHLMHRTATDADTAEILLRGISDMVSERYSLFLKHDVKNIDEYNKTHELQHVVVIIDEIADILYENETLSDRLVLTAQISRAAGIHFVIATQRPSADIINGRIKANFPARLAFRCASVQDSMIVLGAPGAERLQRAGDFIYKEAGISSVIQARAVWVQPACTPLTTAAVSAAAKGNIPSLIDLTTGVNVEQFTKRYDNTKILKQDVRATLHYILLNKIDNINKNELIHVIINGQIRDKIMRVLTHENIIMPNGTINMTAIERVVKNKL